MRQELLMPKLGLTMTEGTVSEWAVAPGGKFGVGDTLLVIESDKVAVEIPAECDGVLIETTANVGDVVSVGAVVGYIDAPGKAPSGAVGAAQTITGTAATPPAAPRPSATAVVAAKPSAEGRVVATPLARRIATDMAIDLRKVAGTGPRGRIRADDVRPAGALRGTEPPASTANLIDKSVRNALVKPTSNQAAMARRLTAAKQQIPHFYLAAEADVSRLLSARAEINDLNPAVKLTLNHMVITAIARALRDLPEANRVWTEEGIQSFDKVDVGVAVNTERGLLVPVVRDIGHASMAEIAARATDSVDRARLGALKPADVGGGAITVSNAGMYQVTWMTPIINPGTAMILGVGSIRDVFRPDAEGKPLLRREMGLVLAADHRLVDGVAGLTFLNRVIEHLRNPLALLLPKEP